jgi:hypothetical protein
MPMEPPKPFLLPLKDIRTCVWRLEGFWKSQDFSKYEQNRKYITTVLSDYDLFTLNQMKGFIELEIQDSAYQIRKLQDYQKNLRALRTIIEKETALRFGAQTQKA